MDVGQDPEFACTDVPAGPARLPGGLELAVGSDSCVLCEGHGARTLEGRVGKPLVTCNCAWRGAFRACLNRYVRFRLQQHAAVLPSSLQRFDFHGKRGGMKAGYVWGRRAEEFCADFELVARRVLADADWRVFWLHFLLGADWKLCCRRLSMVRGNFFHAVYRIERQLGRAFFELAPYPLFPLNNYFSGWVGGRSAVSLFRHSTGGRAHQRLRPLVAAA